MALKIVALDCCQIAKMITKMALDGQGIEKRYLSRRGDPGS
jgi:hypothetical protein